MKKLFYFITALLIASAGYSQTSAEYYNRGNAKYKLKDYRGAIADYDKAIDKAIEITTKYADVYYGRGLAKSNFQDNREAIADFTKAIEINPLHEYAYLNRGDTKFRLQDNLGAIADYCKALEINPIGGKGLCQ